MPFSKYRKTSNYGWRNHPIRGGRRFHAGVDLVKKTGGVNAPIEAFIGGKVVHAGWGNTGSGIGGYGNVVIIKDANGRGHVYAHLDSVSVKKGQTVSKGQKIGNQGATPPENVTGAHLHYEVRKKTSPSFGWTSNMETATLNPESYVKNFKEGSGRVVEKLVVDGNRGDKTIRRWQQFCGTPVDGVISKPVSTVIKAWQRFLNKYGKANLKVDGIEGPATIKAGQRFFGTPVDGKISKPSSLYIKALQEFLNSYGQ